MANRKSDEKKKKIDVSHRNRDELGRFAKKEESKLLSDRPIKLIKVKGSYKTYIVKERWFTEDERIYIWFMTSLAIIIFLI
ncbi:hypothetical protein [Alkalihalophilus pseudofirmus]|uniref:hypothetical protein n=1 Tax=Alkalihalophilus pseudofirmus TaxID=79885 RepID=UPI00158BF358